MDGKRSNSTSGSSDAEKRKSSSGRRRPPPPMSPPPLPPSKKTEPKEEHDEITTPIEDPNKVQAEEEPSLCAAPAIEKPGTPSAEFVEEMLSVLKMNKQSNLVSELNSVVNNSSESNIGADDKIDSSAESEIKTGCKEGEKETDIDDSSAARGRKPPPPVTKPRGKPPPPPRKPPKSVLSHSTGNSPDGSRSNSPHGVNVRSHSPNVIKSRSPSPKPPLPKKPGLPAKPTSVTSSPSEKTEKCSVQYENTGPGSSPLLPKKTEKSSPVPQRKTEDSEVPIEKNENSPVLPKVTLKPLPVPPKKAENSLTSTENNESLTLLPKKAEKSEPISLKKTEPLSVPTEETAALPALPKKTQKPSPISIKKTENPSTVTEETVTSPVPPKRTKSTNAKKVEKSLSSSSSQPDEAESVSSPKEKTESVSSPKEKTESVSPPKEKTESVSPPKEKTESVSPPKEKTESVPSLAQRRENSKGSSGKPASKKSLKRISPMNASFTTEDLDLMHKPVEEEPEMPSIRREDSGDGTLQRAVKKDKRRSKSVGAPAFIEILEQMQAKAMANGGFLKGPPILKKPKLAETTTTNEPDAEGSSKNLGVGIPESGASVNEIGDSLATPPSNHLKNKPNSLKDQSGSYLKIPKCDRPGSTPPAMSKTMVCMDIDLSETPKRPTKAPVAFLKTPGPKPKVTSKPKALPKPASSKAQGDHSPPETSKPTSDITSGTKSELKTEETLSKSVCDKENIFKKNKSASFTNLIRSDKGLSKNGDGSAENVKDHKAKKKKKSLSERFSMRKSTGSGSVFYNNVDDEAVSTGASSTFYVGDNSNNGTNNVESGSSLQNSECRERGSEHEANEVQPSEVGVEQNTQIVDNPQTDKFAEEPVHGLVRFCSKEGDKNANDEQEKTGKSTPEVHYYETVQDQDDSQKDVVPPKAYNSSVDVPNDLECSDNDDLQDALDRTVSVWDDQDVQKSMKKQVDAYDDSKIYDNNFFAANERRSGRSKSHSESRSERGSEHIKPLYENMESINSAGPNEDSNSDSEFYDDDSFSDESDVEDEPNQMSQPVLEETIVEPKNKVKNIAMELCTTERAYVSKLKLVDQVFQNRIISENRAFHMFPDSVIPQMFSNIKSIYQFHNDFLLVQLEKRMEQWDEQPKIGDLMKRFAPFLKLYTDYVQNYDNARNTINTWLQKSPKFASLIEEIQKSPECGFLTLQHHMLEPVQRVPRYELLLKQYIGHLPEDSDDKEDAVEALRLVSTAASHSNEAMAKLDKFRKLWAVNESLGGAIDLMSPTLELIKEGRVIKISQRNAYQMERYLFLFSEMLLVCTTLPVAIGNQQYKMKDELSLDGMHVLEGDNLITPNTFYVKSKERSMEFHFTSHEEKMEWHVTIVNTVAEYTRKQMVRQPARDITENDTALGVRAPTWIKDQETSMCMLCSSTFTKITRRRHHCRACGIVVCGKCSRHSVKLPYDDYKLNRVCDKCYGILSGGKIPLAKSESGQDPRRKGILHVKASDKSLICGYMQMSHDKKTWQKRWFAAHDNFVLYSFKAHQDVVALTSMPLPGQQTGEDKDEHDKEIIKLFHKGQKTYYFQADDSATLNRWKTVLSALTQAEIPDSYA